jgi:RNA polymerase sigma factor (sigma-70 family)
MNRFANAKRPEDAEWMRRYLKDDASAFEAIYAAYADAVYGYLVKRVWEVEEREEAFQKIWLKFHRSRGRWSPEYPLLQWLFVISRSVLIDRYRNAAHTALDRAEHPGESLERTLANLPSESGGPEERILEAEEERAEAELARDLRKTGLSEDQIAVVSMRAIDEEEYERIAARLGKTPASVRKIYSRAIEKLKTMRWSPHRGGSR